MANYSVCGINCDTCKYREAQNCKGCKLSAGKIFWGECELYKCSSEKKHEHCGMCSDFPCNKLQEWAAQENPERIDNLRQLTENR